MGYRGHDKLIRLTRNRWPSAGAGAAGSRGPCRQRDISHDACHSHGRVPPSVYDDCHDRRATGYRRFRGRPRTGLLAGIAEPPLHPRRRHRAGGSPCPVPAVPPRRHRARRRGLGRARRTAERGSGGRPPRRAGAARRRRMAAAGHRRWSGRAGRRAVVRLDVARHRAGGQRRRGRIAAGVRVPLRPGVRRRKRVRADSHGGDAR